MKIVKQSSRKSRNSPVFFLPCSILLLWILPGSLSAETWKFSAEHMNGRQSDEDKVTVLEGGARVTSDKMDIRAERLELSGDDFEMISGNGGVSLTDKEKGIVMESQRFDYDRNRNIIRFRGQVSLVDEEEGLTIRAESLNFLEDDDVLILQAAVRLIQDNIIARGEFATFQRKSNQLEISGRPVVLRDGDEYRAQRIKVNLDTDDIIMEGKVSGTLITETKSETEGKTETDETKKKEEEKKDQSSPAGPESLINGEEVIK